MKALAILNPGAGGGRPLKVWPKVRERFVTAGWRVTDATAWRDGHPTDLAAAAAREGYDVVVAVGGDGTAHWVANGILRGADQGPALAIVPAGTATDFAAALGLPRNPEAATAVLLSGQRRRVDVGRMNDTYFLTIGTVGFGGEVARQVNAWPRLLPGPVMYVAGILKMLVVYDNAEMDVTLDGAPRRERLFMVGVGNTFRAAGGMKLCPTARPDDASLEVLLIKDVTKAEVLYLLPQVFSGAHVRHHKVEVIPATRVTVSSPRPLALQADGELVGTVPATFTVLPRRLEVLAPEA